MIERRCPGCSSLLQPGTLHCAGCGRFRYRVLLRFVLLVSVAVAAFVVYRMWRR
jgi:hypothetical protein